MMDKDYTGAANKFVEFLLKREFPPRFRMIEINWQEGSRVGLKLFTLMFGYEHEIDHIFNLEGDLYIEMDVFLFHSLEVHSEFMKARRKL